MSLEVLVEQQIAGVPTAALAHGRAEWDRRTGAFAADEPFYEERIRAFFDWFLIEYDRGERLRDPALGAVANALATSMRSLWRAEFVDSRVILKSLLHGVQLEIGAEDGPAQRLRPSDIFDGRVVALSGRAMLAPGPVFHPRTAHEALLDVLEHARREQRLDSPLLEPLLRMRMRLDRFPGMQPRHIYRYESLDRTEILSAPWVPETRRPFDATAAPREVEEP